MFMKERIIAFCAALLMMLQCCIAGASELKKEPDMLLTNERTWDIRNAQYTIFAKPPWAGRRCDAHGRCEDSGELRLFYLQDWRDGKPTYHPFHSFTTSRFRALHLQGRGLSPSQTSAITTWHWVPAR